MRDGATNGSGPLPPGWAPATLGELVFPLRPKLAPDSKSDLPFLGLDAIEPNGLRIVSAGRFGDMKSAASRFESGDVLYGRLRPYLNKVWRAEYSGAASAEFIVFPANPFIDSDFLKFLLHHSSFVRFASHLVSGDRPRIDLEQISQYSLSLPPLPEQRRIVAKIEELFGEIEAGEQELEKAREGLAAYRRAVLKAAVTGELTREWRDKNAPNETGADLLNRILIGRRASWGGKSRCAEPVLPDLADLPILPAGWVWASLDQLVAEGPTNGYSPVSSGASTGTKALKLTATTSGFMRLNQRAFKYIDEKINQDSKYWLRPGDIVLQRGNTIEYVGIAAIFDGLAGEFIYPDLMIRVRLVEPRLNGWVWRTLNSPSIREWIKARATGTAGTMPKINGQIVRSIPIPLPPVAEIGRALEIADEALAVSEEAHQTLSRLSTETSRLRQSILAAAFSGKLVPQDPADEPAIVLLERFRAAKASAEPQNRGSRSAPSTPLVPRRRGASGDPAASAARE